MAMGTQNMLMYMEEKGYPNINDYRMQKSDRSMPYG